MPMRYYRKFAAARRNPRRCVVAAFLLSLSIAILITALRGVPAPCAHDEFSYLLGADTFVCGRLANEPHPMWQHFESFHVIHQPTYVSKYPPAQALVLAVGQRLGHPIVGCWIATATATAAVVWMIAAWLPRRYWWLAVLFTVAHPGIQLVWGQSYWGGAVAMTGAALLVGAYGRLSHRMEWQYALIAGLGTLVLANSRPFEGAALTAGVGLGLLWKLQRNRKWRPRPFILRVIAPGFAVLLVGAGLMMLQNRAVTGSPIKMAYQIHEATYGWNSLFVWQSAGDPPVYRHAMMERFFHSDKTHTENSFATLVDVLAINWNVVLKQMRFFCSDIRFIAVFGIPFLLVKSRYRELGLLMLPPFVAALTTPWGYHAHYFAPAAPMILTLFLGGFIEVWRRSDSVTARRLVLCAALGLFVFSTCRIHRDFTNPYLRNFANQRAEIASQLKREDGRDLVFVRYEDDHDAGLEWVYNMANIENADIVWAREMPEDGRDEALVEHFAGRKVWVVHADANPPYLQGYSKRRSEVRTTSSEGIVSSN